MALSSASPTVPIEPTRPALCYGSSRRFRRPWASLSDRQRLVIMLLHGHEWSMREIADSTNQWKAL